jgi:hypothetical protein
VCVFFLAMWRVGGSVALSTSTGDSEQIIVKEAIGIFNRNKKQGV